VFLQDIEIDIRKPSHNTDNYIRFYDRYVW